MSSKNETMTPRERWRAVLDHRIPDRVPMDYWGTPEITQKLIQHLNCVDRYEMFRKLKIDFVVSVGPNYIGPELPAGEDVFGRKGRSVDYGTGNYWEVTSYPLAGYHSVYEIETNYHWPDPDWWDYREIPAQIRGWEEYPVRGGGSEPFLIYKELRGQEQALVDLVENPEIVEYCLDKLFNLAYQDTLRIFEAIPDRVDFSYVAEDLGGQENLLFSPGHIRKFLFPGMRRMIELIHSAGAKVFHHNDGNITKILPDLVGLGIDILNPIQWRASGMDRASLKKQYGNILVFHGGMDNQYTLPFGSAKDVEQEVLDNLALLGKGGGYILAPCHNIQSVTPHPEYIDYVPDGISGWLDERSSLRTEKENR
jgi:uroporphyrinogen decarboxylase